MPEIVGHEFAPYEFAEWPKWVQGVLCSNDTEARVAEGRPTAEQEEAAAEAERAAEAVKADAERVALTAKIQADADRVVAEAATMKVDADKAVTDAGGSPSTVTGGAVSTPLSQGTVAVTGAMGGLVSAAVPPIASQEAAEIA